MTILDTELFPTPVPVIKRMIAPLIKNYSGRDYLKFYGTTILDPQGGCGDIPDYIQETFGIKQRDFYVIEINPDLRHVLQGKGYRVIGTDFLTYDEPISFDLILSNPPFSTGVTHALKAYDILSDGGSLHCLLNAQTLKNPCSIERERLLHLLAKSADLQFNAGSGLDALLFTLENLGIVEWLGQCFKDSERPTDVEVVLIHLSKPEKEKIEFDCIDFDFDGELGNGAFNPNTIAHRDVIFNLVSRYNATRQILIDRWEMQGKLNFYLNGISRPVYDTAQSDKEASLVQSVTIEEQLRILKSRFWNTLFEKTELGNRTTSDFQKEFTKFTRSQSSLAFTVDNVKEVLLIFMSNFKKLMMDSLVKVFDEATSHHADNRVSEGWKTNKSWKLNKRIIMPYGITFDGRFGDRFSISYHRQDFLGDLDKILCMIANVKYENIQSTFYAIDKFCDKANSTGVYQEPFESSFFKIRIYKKGTMHLDFLNLKYLEDFNRLAAEGKNWIGSEEPMS